MSKEEQKRKMITINHLYTLMGTDKIVIRFYRGKKRLDIMTLTPKKWEEYLDSLNYTNELFTTPNNNEVKND